MKGFDVKKFTGGIRDALMPVGKEGGVVLGIGLGMVGSSKFLKFDELLKNQPADGFLRKNEGLVKLVVAAGLAGAMTGGAKSKMLRYLLWGVALEGGLKFARQMMTNKTTGKSFFEPIGLPPREIQRQLDESVAGAGDEGLDMGVAGPVGEEEEEDAVFVEM